MGFMEYNNENHAAFWVLIAIMLIGLFFALISIEERDKLSDVVTIAREQYDTENITLLKELEDKKTYLKYELLVKGELKQAIYIKDTSEVVMIE